MDTEQAKEHKELLHKILDNIDGLEKRLTTKIDTLEKETKRSFEKVDTQFQSLSLSITLIGADVDQLKRRVSRIERHLEIADDAVRN